MKITPKKGYVLVSNQEMPEKKREGVLIMPGEEKKKTYLRVESDGELYTTGQCIICRHFNSKVQAADNLFLIAEEDIVASFEISAN